MGHFTLLVSLCSALSDKNNLQHWLCEWHKRLQCSIDTHNTKILIIHFGKCSAGRGRGKLQPQEELKENWHEDGADCPPPSTAAVSGPPPPASGRWREMMDGQASPDAYKTVDNVKLVKQNLRRLWTTNRKQFSIRDLH